MNEKLNGNPCLLIRGSGSSNYVPARSAAVGCRRGGDVAFVGRLGAADGVTWLPGNTRRGRRRGMHAAWDCIQQQPADTAARPRNTVLGAKYVLPLSHQGDVGDSRDPE